jgi:hypothetical protein
MHEKAMSEALDAIHEEVTKLLAKKLPAGVEQGLHLIASLARYKHDVRGAGMAQMYHEEPYERDGIVYRLMADQKDGNLWGRWHCLACNEGGESTKACSSMNDAVAVARDDLGMHHALKHCKVVP